MVGGIADKQLLMSAYALIRALCRHNLDAASAVSEHVIRTHGMGGLYAITRFMAEGVLDLSGSRRELREGGPDVRAETFEVFFPGEHGDQQLVKLDQANPANEGEDAYSFAAEFLIAQANHENEMLESMFMAAYHTDDTVNLITALAFMMRVILQREPLHGEEDRLNIRETIGAC